MNHQTRGSRICTATEQLAVAMLYQEGVNFRRQLDLDPAALPAAEKLTAALRRDPELREIIRKIPD